MAANSFDEAEVERLNAIERKILQKYGGSPRGACNSNLTSGFESLRDCTDANQVPRPSQVMLPSSEESSASSKISICSHCAGVGKLYESIAVSGPAGIRRILESCCTKCKGLCYITNEENEAPPRAPTNVLRCERNCSDDSNDLNEEMSGLLDEQLANFGPCPFLLQKSVAKPSSSSTTPRPAASARRAAASRSERGPAALRPTDSQPTD